MNLKQLTSKFYADYKAAELTREHIAVLAFHILAGFFFYAAYAFGIASKESLISWIHFYYILSPIILFISFYEELRNYKVYLLWLLTATLQFLVFLFLKNDPVWSAELGNSLTPVKALFVMLISLQAGRQLFMLLHPGELIIPYWRTSWFDEDDNRRISWLDIFFSILIFAVTVLACLF